MKIVTVCLFVVSIVNAFFSKETCPRKCVCTLVNGRIKAWCRDQSGIPVGLHPDVKILDVADNNLKAILSDAFERSNLLNLEEVSIRDASVSWISVDAFSSLPKLSHLDASGNELYQIHPMYLRENHLLKHVNFSRNYFSVLPDRAFLNLKYLRTVDFSHCRLKFIGSRAFIGAKNLTEIFLHGNSLTTLNAAPFNHLKSLSILTLHENPWKCNCQLLELWKSVRNTHLISTTSCRNPSHLSGSLWNNLTEDLFSCQRWILSPEEGSSETSVSSNGQITISCRISSDFPLEVHWTFMSTVIKNSSIIHKDLLFTLKEGIDWDSHNTHGRWVNLTVKLLAEKGVFQGDFSCVARNNEDYDQRTVTVVLEKGSVVWVPYPRDYVVTFLITLAVVSQISLIVLCFLSKNFRKAAANL